MTLLLKRWARFYLQPALRRERRELKRLRQMPRYTPTQTWLLGTPLDLVDPRSFRSMYRDIMQRQIYRFETECPQPYIIDGGANIGVATIFFKQLFPASRLVAFEADAAVFEALQRNVARFGLSDVTLVQKALWDSEDTIDFVREGGDSGRIRRAQDPDDTAVVETVRLRDYLTEPVHFLKLDIEGAEFEVLEDCAGHLGRVERLFVEYHSFVDEPQRLGRLLELLKDAGFRYDVERIGALPEQPYVERAVQNGMDMNLNVFAYRPSLT